MATGRIYEWARSQPEKLAIVHGDYALSYASLAYAIDGLCRYIDTYPLPVGGTAVAFAENIAEAWVLSLALRAMGLNALAIESVEQAALHAPKDAACVVVIQSEPDLARLKPSLFPGARMIVIPVAVMAESQRGDVPLSPPRTVPFGGHYLTSSGTTGTHKRMLASGAVEHKRNEARARSQSFNRDTVYHGLNFALWSSVGFKNPLAIWHVGGTVVLDQYPGAFKRFFHDPITCSSITPPQLKQLVEATEENPATRQVELIVTAGVLSLELAQLAARRLTEKITVSYGCSEMATPPLYSHFRDMDDLLWLEPSPGRRIEIVDAAGAECPVGVEGELRTPVTEIDCKAYVNDDAANARVFREGCFYPGDMAVQRADGRIRILGRTADVLNVRGTKVAVGPIEAAIKRQLGVGEVCVFAGLNDAGDEELAVAIESDRAFEQAELDALAAQLPKFERIRFRVLPSFPRTETGMAKVHRTALRKMVFGDDATGS